MMLADVADRIRKALVPKLKLQNAYKRIFANQDSPHVCPSCGAKSDGLNPEAQLILNSLIRNSYVTTPTFVPGDPYLSAVNEGKRQVVIAMLNQIHMDPEKLTKQIEQAYENSENGR